MGNTSIVIDLDVEQLELGRLYSKILNFEKALLYLKREAETAKTIGNMGLWAKCVPLILRILAEQMNTEEFEYWKQEIQSLDLSYSNNCSSLSYALGIGACYSGQTDLARNHFENALSSSECRLDLVQAQFGLASVFSIEKKFDRAIESLMQLELQLQDTLLTDFKIATLQLKSVCFRETQDFNQALSNLDKASHLAKIDYNLFMSINLTFLIGTVYEAMGNLAKAKVHYDVVSSMSSLKNMAHLDSQLQSRINRIQNQNQRIIILEDQTDLRATVQGHESKSFGNQRILYRLLKILGESKKDSLSKEKIVELLWKESYDPLVHDNKIYVTIRRLRKILELDSGEAIVIKDENGYRLANDVFVQLGAS